MSNNQWRLASKFIGETENLIIKKNEHKKDKKKPFFIIIIDSFITII